MKFPHALLLASVAFLSACASSNSSKSSPAPASVPIVIYNDGQLPKSYKIMGQVSGPNLYELEEQARKLGANGIINPRSKDPVSGWATTDAILVGK